MRERGLRKGPRSLAARLRVLARLALLAQIGELVRRLREERLERRWGFKLGARVLGVKVNANIRKEGHALQYF